jgi:hypothetical protein
MTRILKSLGVAMAAIAALVAVMAPAASAEPGTLTAPQYPAFVTSQQQGGGATFDIGEGAAVGCAVSRLDATIGQAANPVTFRPTYENCIAQPGGLPATVVTNGCDYRIGFTQPGSTGLPETTGTMKAALICPPEQQIEIHVYAGAMAHEENVAICTYDILPQPAVQAGVYHNSVMAMPKDVLATVKASFTADSTIAAGMGCGGNPMMNGHLPVTLTGEYTMRGFEDIMGVEGAQIDLDVG